MRIFKKFVTLAAVSGLLLFAVGCGDTTSETTSNDERPDGTTDTPGEDGQLRHIGNTCEPDQVQCTVTLTTGVEQDLEVELIDGDDQPVHDAEIAFEIEQQQGASITLGSASTYTDSGEASTTVNSGESVGTATVSASAPDYDDIDPIEWEVVVSSKDRGPYQVSFDYQGETDIGEIDVRLFDSGISCADLEADPNQTAAMERSDAVSSSGQFPTVSFPDIQNGDSFTVAAYAHSYEHEAVEAAYGCEDDTDEVESGEPVEVVVDLYDHLPRVAGEYAVSHQFDLRDALPENVRNVVDLIGRFATDPGSFVLGCPEDGADDCPADSLSVVGLLLDFLPDDSEFKETIDDFLGSDIANSVARDAINDIAGDWLSGVPGYDEAGDIYETFRQFRVDGIIRIEEEPQVTIDEDSGEVVGDLADDAGYQQWEEITVNWTGDCTDDDPQDCPERSFGTRDLDQDTSAVEGEFGGTVTVADGLLIDQHPLSLNYGALLVAIVENVVFPEIFGESCGDDEDEPCDSFEDALASMLDCADVADEVADEGDSTYDIVENLCTNLRDQAGARLREYASEELVADGDDVFEIGSAAACDLHQPSSYEDGWETDPLPYADMLGQEDEQCEWDVTVQFNDGDPTEVGGEFWGERESF